MVDMAASNYKFFHIFQEESFPFDGAFFTPMMSSPRSNPILLFSHWTK